MSYTPTITSISPSKYGVEVQCEHNIQVSIQAWSSTIWKVFVTANGVKENPSVAVLGAISNVPDLKYFASDEELSAQTSKGNVAKLRKSDGCVKFSYDTNIHEISLVKDWLFVEKENTGTFVCSFIVQGI